MESEATLTFTVAENTDATFSISLPNNRYSDVENNNNKETLADFLINITIDTIAPAITTPLENYAPSITNSFDLTIEFDEPLNFDSSQGIVLTTTDILAANLIIEDATIDNGNGGKGRIVITATIAEVSLTVTSSIITISSDSYSDTLGNTGKNNYTLIIDIETLVLGWLTAGGNDCQNFHFDDGDGSTDNPYQISHICQLQNIDANDVTIGGIAYTDLLSKNYLLIADINGNYTENWNNGAGFAPFR